MEFLNGFLNFIKDQYDIIVTLLALILLIWSMYNKIRYLCLEKASKMIVDAEANTQLTGEEKFALVLKWINEALPKIFRNSFIRSFIEKIVQFVYDNCFEYMKKYIKRKTGYDISTVINIADINKVVDTVLDDKTENKKE